MRRLRVASSTGPSGTRLRSFVLPAAVALVVTGLPAPAALAAADCSVELPATVAIDSYTVAPRARTSSDCLGRGPLEATWLFGHGTSGTTPLSFSVTPLNPGVGREVPIVIGDRDPVGTYTAVPAGAETADGTPLTQNTEQTVVKYASSIGAGLWRTPAPTLSWDIDAMTWSGRTHGWYPRANAQVSLWHLPLDGTAWKYLRTQTMSSRGTGTVTVDLPKPGHYRVSMAETATVWGVRSTPVATPVRAMPTVPGCHLDSPSTVVVGQARQTVYWYLGDDCEEASGGGATASWELRDPSGRLVETLDIETPSPVRFYDFHQFADTAPTGRYSLTPTGITPSWLSQNSPDVVVKYESRTKLSGSWRPGGDVTISALATSWSGRLHDWYPRQGVQVQLMWRPQADFVWEIAPWTWVKNATTGSTGRATFELPNARLGEYRVRVLETASVFGSGSSTYYVG